MAPLNYKNYSKQLFGEIREPKGREFESEENPGRSLCIHVILDYFY